MSDHSVSQRFSGLVEVLCGVRGIRLSRDVLATLGVEGDFRTVAVVLHPRDECVQLFSQFAWRRHEARQNVAPHSLRGSDRHRRRIHGHACPVAVTADGHLEMPECYMASAGLEDGDLVLVYRSDHYEMWSRARFMELLFQRPGLLRRRG